VRALLEQVILRSHEPTSRLTFPDAPRGAHSHEINGIRRGLGVEYNGVDIVGEGMGIAAPVCSVHGRTIFPLHAEDRRPLTGRTRIFHLNAVSTKKLSTLHVDPQYRPLRKMLTPLYLRNPSFRPLFTFLTWTRTALGLKAVYTPIEEIGKVTVSYRPENGGVNITVDSEVPREAPVLVANELSGRYFSQLLLENGRPRRIPPWTEISADSALLYSPTLNLTFKAYRTDGTRMYVGREVVARRLDWAGFTYLLPPGVDQVQYRLEFGGASLG